MILSILTVFSMINSMLYSMLFLLVVPTEYMPPTWKLAQLRVIESSPSLPSVVSKPSSSSLLLVTLYSANSLLSNILLPFNSAILDQYSKQLSANLDSIKKGEDESWVDTYNVIVINDNNQ